MLSPPLPMFRGITGIPAKISGLAPQKGLAKISGAPASSLSAPSAGGHANVGGVYPSDKGLALISTSKSIDCHLGCDYGFAPNPPPARIPIRTSIQRCLSRIPTTL